MAYDTDTLRRQALEAIKGKKLVFIDEVIQYVKCGRKAFFNHELNKDALILDAIGKNKIDMKSILRLKWFKSDNATLQISLYKLISSDEERKKLSQQFHELSGDVSLVPQIDTSKVKTETLADLFENGIIEDEENENE